MNFKDKRYYIEKVKYYLCVFAVTLMFDLMIALMFICA